MRKNCKRKLISTGNIRNYKVNLSTRLLQESISGAISGKPKAGIKIGSGYMTRFRRRCDVLDGFTEVLPEPSKIETVLWRLQISPISLGNLPNEYSIYRVFYIFCLSAECLQEVPAIGAEIESLCRGKKGFCLQIITKYK